MIHKAWTSFNEFLQLAWLKLVVTKRNFVDFCKVAFNFYSNGDFFKRDVALLSEYILKSPFTISKDFLSKHNADDLYVYGETPLTTMKVIADNCQIKKSDVVYELGSGRGRNCFWLNSFIGCKVVGIEHIPQFVEKSQKIVERFAIKDLVFREGDFLQADYNGATVIYLYGTCLDEDSIQALISKFAKLPSGTKIITVSYPLTDYTKEPIFEVMKRFPAEFTWGTGDVYLQLRK